ncbi:hypothetical protein H0H81_003355 [Sphagnurus paluster]|uniref:F-box domain-containing protein n=1 Tax=Sphagnurus paluster TaxID=117069 RepID=A0A9P7KHM5_9AGAR|nr:hypothetical protein H0H81_003355 [Sphagnurus paluster]
MTSDILYKIDLAGTSNIIQLSKPERQIALDLLSLSKIMAKDVELTQPLLERLCVALAPHKRLPEELLSEIFVLCMPCAAIIVPPIVGEHTPWTLRRVCAPWRRIALGESRLWNNLQLRRPFSWDLKGEKLQKYLEHLQREIVHPTLPISFDFYGSEPTGAFVSTVRAYFLQPDLHRFRHLSMGDTHSINEVLRISGTSLANLSSLTISSNSASAINSLSRPVPLFQNGLASLRRLKLELGNPRAELLVPPNIPWHQLTDLMLSTPSSMFNVAFLDVLSAAKTLRQCNSLVRCCIAVNPRAKSNEVTNDTVIKPVSLPTLRAFELLCVPKTHVSTPGANDPVVPFLDALEVPALVELRIRGYNAPNQHATLSALVHRSSCSLRVCELLGDERLGYPRGVFPESSRL